MKLKDKVAIVTGGGQGIGEGIVRCLAEEGADVAIIDLNGDNARTMASELEAMGRKSLAVETDATEIANINQAVEKVLTHFGQIDILVNNVGGMKGDPEDRVGPGRITNRTEDEWQGSYEINLKSHIFMCKAVIPHFQEKKAGKIVNIASDAAKMASVEVMPYATFKAADIQFTRSLATELAHQNINVNCILPGYIYSPLWAGGAQIFLGLATQSARDAGNTEMIETLEKMDPKDWWRQNIVNPTTPMRREQTAEDIGKAAVFLVSEDARNITGQALSVDGGMVMH